MTKFCLLVKYETGECGYITNTPDIQEALNEFIDKLKADRAGQNFKCYSLPKIIEARLVKLIG